MANCRSCGAGFHPIVDAWGSETCGQCLAAQLERILVQHVLGDRMPMRRAARDDQPVIDQNPEQRRA